MNLERLTPSPSCRSLLVTPAVHIDRFHLAAHTADVHLVDLEDSVPWDRKDEARSHVCSIADRSPDKRFSLRINSLRCAAGQRDLLTVIDHRVRPEILVIPKVESPEEIAIIADSLDDAGCDTYLWALIESVRGVDAAAEIAQASNRISALTFGLADYCAETGTAMQWDALIVPRSRIASAARCAGLDAVDGPTFALDDQSELRSDSIRASSLGYTGKIAVHPAQVAVINEAFTPDPAEVARAERIVAAFANDQRGIITFEGQMLGPPILRQAQMIVRRAKKGDINATASSI